MNEEPITIYDLGFNRLINRELTPLVSLDVMQSSLDNAFLGGTDPAGIGSGEFIENLVVKSGYIKSADFVSGSAGWQIAPTTCEFNSGYFRGDISAATGTFTGGLAIGTSPDWFKVDANGNIWSGADTLANAKTDKFAVENTGTLYAYNGVIAGTLTIGGRLATIVGGAINADGDFINDLINTNLDTAAKTILGGFTFSPTDYSGAFKTGDIAWNTTTGAITSGSGGVFNKAGLIFCSRWSSYNYFRRNNRKCHFWWNSISSSRNSRFYHCCNFYRNYYRYRFC